MSEQKKKGARQKVSDGINKGIGVLSAFKDALEETIEEARERGDLSAERAREIMKDAMSRAQQAAEGAREKLDLAREAELDELRGVVDGLRRRIERVEAEIFGDEPGDVVSADAAADERKGEEGSADRT